MFGTTSPSSTSSTIKRLLAGGVLAVTLVGVAPAVASAQTDADAGAESTDEGRPHRGARLDALADYLGITREDLKEQLHDGMTLSEIAEANGVSTEDLQAEMVDRITERVETALADGRISEDRAERILDAAEERVERLVDTTREERQEERRERRADRLGERADRIGDRLDRLQDGDDATSDESSD